ncbi:hypothetical protein LguiB_001184 [Lonicera macranthoides]
MESTAQLFPFPPNVSQNSQISTLANHAAIPSSKLHTLLPLFLHQYCYSITPGPEEPPPPNGASTSKNVNQSRAMLKLGCRYHLRHHICGIILGANFLQNYFTTLDNLPYKMKPNIDVLRPSVMNLVLG